MTRHESNDGADLAALFFDSSYVEQHLDLPSGRRITYLALWTAYTDPDLTGQILWPGCILLMHWIDRHISVFNNRSVIEIGAGTGVCSLFIATHGNPSSVLATDGSAPVVELIERNVAFHCRSGSVQVRTMRWTRAACRGVCAEFGKFDFVIGSEIAYDENYVEALVDSVDDLLSPGGRFIIGHIERYAQTTRALHSKLARSGFVKDEEADWNNLVGYKMALIVG
jgi:predicted nicotinamide N-methyase